MKKNRLISWAVGGLLSLYAGVGYAPASGPLVLEAPASVEQTLETKVDNDLPHYLRDVKSPDNEVDQIIEMYKTLHTTKGQYDYAILAKNNSIIFVEDVYGKDVNFILPEYSKEDGYVAYHTTLGKEKISFEEFEIVKKDLVKTLKQAVDMAYEDQKEWPARIITIQEKQFRESGKLEENESLEDGLKRISFITPEETLTDGLNKKLSEFEPKAEKFKHYKHLRLRDILKIPDIKKQKFVPRELHLTPMNPFGLCYLDTGIVMYHPLARMLDHTGKKPLILMHELNHNNEELQVMPYSGQYDVELFATIPMLDDMNALWFMRHPYTNDIRRISKVLFGFESERAFNESLEPKFYVEIDFNREKLGEYINAIHKFSKEFKKWALEEFIPEYYANRGYWDAVSEDMKNQGAPLIFMAYAKFEPTLLNGPRKTKDWLDQHELVIKEISRKSEEELEEENGDSQDGIIILRDKKRLQDIAEILDIKEDYNLKDLQKILNQLQELEILRSRR